MKRIILIFFLFLPSLVFADNNSYFMNLNYNMGNITVQNIIASPGFAPGITDQPVIGYKLELLSFQNEILYSFKFTIPNVIFVQEAPPVILDEVNFSLSFQYFKNGRTINIYDPNNTKILSLDISHLADVCGDNICEDIENFVNCPRDCPSGFSDGYCDGISDGRCDPDCAAEQDEDCVVPTTIITTTTIPKPEIKPKDNFALFLAVIIITLCFVLFVKYETEKKINKILKDIKKKRRK